jgi:hypothetical protein
MNQGSPVLQSLLVMLRQHPGFPEFCAHVPKPVIHPFAASKAELVESARARWIFESGQQQQHNQWLGFLTGNHEQET